MTARIRSAIVGCGAISREHLQFLANDARVSLVGVCDRSPAASSWTAQRYGSTAFTDYAAMLAASSPDVVHVLTPPSSHRALADAALDAGAHVIVEKPIAPSSVELDALLSHAASAGRFVIENYNYRFNDQMIAIDELVQSGALGDVVATDVLLVLGATNKTAAATGISTAHMAGGLVRDFLTHMSYLGIDRLGGAPIGDVDARWWNRSGNDHLGTDELDARVMVGDAVATLRFSARMAPDCFRVWVRGTQGSVETDLYQPFLRVETQRGPALLSPVIGHGVNGVSLALSSVRNLRDKVLQRSPYHGLWTLLERTYDAVAAGTAPPVSPEDMRRTNLVIDRIVQNASAR